MFTGIVQALGIVLATTPTDAGKRLTVSLAELAEAKIEAGDSVCVSGVCLTVVRVGNGNAQFDVITETLQRSTLGKKQVQDRVNLELSLRPDSYVGGHFVQGHVDMVAGVLRVKNDPHDWRVTFQVPPPPAVPPEMMACLAPKGSVAVDGVSMTIAEVTGGGIGGGTFTLAVIPTTLERTTLSALKAGDAVNVETDMLARTVVNYLRMQAGGGTLASPERPGGPILVHGESDGAGGAGVTMAKLRELGIV